MSTDERVIPIPATGDLATFTITIDGADLDPEINVGNIIVRKEINKISTATIVLLDGDVADQDFKASNSGHLIPGKEIEIFAGYHSEEDQIFKGVIVSQGLKIRKDKPSQLVVECKDIAFQMTGSRKSAFFTDMTDSDIIEDILGNYGLDTNVESTDATHAEMVQYDCTDWDFVLMRAEANGKLVTSSDGKLEIVTPDLSKEPALKLNYGSTLMEFEASMDARKQIPNYKSTAWDYAGQENVEEESSDPGVSEPGNLDASTLSGIWENDFSEVKHTGIKDQELKAWSDAKLYRSRLAKIIGRAGCQGVALAVPGEILELSGVGDRYNGNHLMTSVRHQLDTEKWKTDIRFGMPDEWTGDKPKVMEKPATAMLPGMKGLQIGVCKQLSDDPDGEFRVLVTLPMIDPEGDGVWARVSTLDAGDGRGSFFRPEIGDEVLLGFLNDDPRYPIVLGMFNSSALPAPLEQSDDNHEKGFVTRSGIKLLFNDDLVSFTVETPNGNLIELSDDEGTISVECENGNSVQLSSDGIVMDSAADIAITAAGDITLEGTNVNITANAEFKAEGSAGAEVSTGAIAVLKGSLVKIN